MVWVSRLGARGRGPSEETPARHGRSAVSAAPGARTGQRKSSIVKDAGASRDPPHVGMTYKALLFLVRRAVLL